MGPPPAKRALNAASPHRRMRRRSDFAKEMRPPGFRVEGGLGFPVDPTDIVLLGRQLERLWEVFMPSAQYLARDPSVRRLADGESAGRLVTKQHEDKLFGLGEFRKDEVVKTSRHARRSAFTPR